MERSLLYKSQCTYWLTSFGVIAFTLWIGACYLAEPWGHSLSEFIRIEDEFSVIPIVFVAPATGLLFSTIIPFFPKTRTISLKIIFVGLAILFYTATFILWINDSSRVCANMDRPDSLTERTAKTIKLLMIFSEDEFVESAKRCDPITHCRYIAQKVWNLCAMLLAATMLFYLIKLVLFKLFEKDHFNELFIKPFSVISIVALAWLFTEMLSHDTFKKAFKHSLLNYELPIIVFILFLFALISLYYLGKGTSKETQHYSRLPKNIVLFTVPPIFSSFFLTIIKAKPQHSAFDAIILSCAAFCTLTYCSILGTKVVDELTSKRSGGKSKKKKK